MTLLAYSESPEQLYIFNIQLRTSIDVDNSALSKLRAKIFSKTETRLHFLKNDLLFLYSPSQGVIINYKQPSNTLGKVIEFPFPLTAVAFDKSGQKLALGDERGRITLITNVFSKKGRNSATLHWHASAVGALTFMDNSTLVSGGQEAVLVFW